MLFKASDLKLTQIYKNKYIHNVCTTKCAPVFPKSTWGRRNQCKPKNGVIFIISNS